MWAKTLPLQSPREHLVLCCVDPAAGKVPESAGERGWGGGRWGGGRGCRQGRKAERFLKLSETDLSYEKCCFTLCVFILREELPYSLLTSSKSNRQVTSFPVFLNMFLISSWVILGASFLCSPVTRRYPQKRWELHLFPL